MIYYLCFFKRTNNAINVSFILCFLLFWQTNPKFECIMCSIDTILIIVGFNITVFADT